MKYFARQVMLSLMAVSVIGASVVSLSGHAAAAVSNSLGVNPRRDYSVPSGQKTNDTLSVTNLSKTDNLTVNIDIIDFGPKNETGTPSLILNTKQQTRWSLKPYLTVPKSVVVAAGKTSQIPISIAIPGNVGAGSYYGAIRYSTAGVETNQNLSLTSSSATLVFVRVPGEANDALRIKSFGPFTPSSDGETGSFGKLYVGAPPKYLAYRVVNTGNVAEQPTGSAEIKNIFSKQVKTFEKANPGNNIVLIDQTRRFDLCINQSQTTQKDPKNNTNTDVSTCNASKLAPGRYTARLALVYGDNGSTSHDLGYVASFWYLPVWFVVVVLLVLVAIAAVIWLAVKAFRGRRYSTHRR